MVKFREFAGIGLSVFCSCVVEFVFILPLLSYLTVMLSVSDSSFCTSVPESE